MGVRWVKSDSARPQTAAAPIAKSGGRPDPPATDIYPQGERGENDVESVILDRIVARVEQIPGVQSAWIIEEGAALYIPQSHPFVLVIRKTAVPYDETNTSRLMRVDCILRVYVIGQDDMSRGLQAMRIEQSLRDVLDKKSIDGLTCGPLTEIMRSRPKKLTGGEENYRMIEHDFYFVYIQENA